jgi:hypothetical protein
MFLSLHEFVFETARLLQCDELLYDLVQRYHLALGFGANVIPIAYIHRSGIEFLLADNYSSRIIT